MGERDPDFEGAKQFAGVIQSVRPDMLLVNEYDQVWIDNDTFNANRTLEGIGFLQDNFLSVSQLGDDPIQYDYVYVAPCNTGTLAVSASPTDSVSIWLKVWLEATNSSLGW